MKKCILMLCIAVSCAMVSYSQDGMKPFKFDISTGYVMTMSTGAGSKAGFLLAIEPKYAVIPSLSVGIRAEVAAAVRGYYAGYSGYDDAEIKAAASYIATADYYFRQNYSFRPFAGVGGGLYSTASADEYDSNEAIENSARSTFGGMARAGFETLHFRFGIEYNLVPNTSFKDYYNPDITRTTKNSYLGIKVGIYIGGGRY